MPSPFGSPFLPARLDSAFGGLTSRQLDKARRFAANAELETFRYRVGARMRADFERADSRAAHDAYDSALDSELRLLARGMARAGTSAAALELVAHRVSGLQAANDERLYRRFGG
jgi:hypothetical protein